MPILKRAIWGGTRLGSLLGKEIGDLSDAAESWELSDITGSESVVRDGPLRGQTLRQVMRDQPHALLGRHAGCSRFPLMMKFLDAREQLSVQVHPRERTRHQDGSLRIGKTEAWVVLAADPGSRMFVGLQPGVTEQQLREAIALGDVTHCLYSHAPQVGDCLLLEPGTVHALGGGILVAEIQEPSDITFRLFDWNRVDAHGQPRELHLEKGLHNTDYARGPVHPCSPGSLPDCTGARLVESTHFWIDRYTGPASVQLAEDHRAHVLVMIAGTAILHRVGHSEEIGLGETVLVPAEREAVTLQLPAGAIVLDTYLPDDAQTNFG